MVNKSKTATQLANDLVDFFLLRYTEHYGSKPKFNRSQAKFQMADVLKDIEFKVILELIEYYFTLTADHSIYDFSANYHNIMEMKIRVEEDAVKREKIRIATMQRVQQYREKNNDQ